MTNSCRKGKRGERFLALYLRSIGFATARRTSQHCGQSGDASDVVAEELPRVFFECKYGVVGLDIGTKLLVDAMEQAERDCPLGKVPVVMWKPKGAREWRATVRMVTGLPTLWTCAASATVLRHYNGD
jgi:Holliday junction resolvase